MNEQEIILTFCRAFEAGDIEQMANLMTDDFILEDFFDQPMPKVSFVSYLRALKCGFPDMRLNLKIIGEDDQCIRATFRFVGTHTRDLDLSDFGFPSWPATGRVVALPLQLAEHFFAGGKLAKLRIQSASGGDFRSLLEHLGLDF